MVTFPNGQENELRPLAELPLVALRAIDDYLVVDGEPRRPAALVLPRDAAALDALQAVHVDRRPIDPHVRMVPDQVRG
jgi:hypothetical protein